jgi:hypothetical protein
VLKNIRNKPFHFSDIAKQKIEQKWVDTTDIRKILTDGDVDFSLSNKPLEGGKLYVITGENSKKNSITLKVINYEEKAVLKDILK